MSRLGLNPVKASPLHAITGGFQGSGDSKKFPSDLDTTGHYVQFTAYERKDPNILAGARGNLRLGRLEGNKKLATFFLPMPANLGTAYSADYQNADIGLIGNFIAENAGTAIDAARNTLSNIGNSILQGADGNFSGAAGSIMDAGSAAFGGVKELGKTLGKELGSPGQKNAAVVGVLAGASNPAKAVLAKEAGRAVNPHRVVLFEGVQFREHQFSYRLSPKSSAESKTVTSIIQGFKYYMLPKFGGVGAGSFTGRAFLEYPQLFTISFKHDTHLFKLLPCVLKSLSVNYHPMGYPAYIRTEDDVAPVEVEIQMTFQETQMFSKESVIEESENIKVRNNAAAEAETEPF